MRWTATQFGDALGIEAPVGLSAEREFSGVSIDSRTIKPDELFLAIHGPRHDGHSFVAELLNRNVIAAVVHRERFRDFPQEVQPKLFAVDDTLAALQRLAAVATERWRGARPGRRIAAVAGSVGKTTTKEILAALLGARFRVLKTEGNLNNEYGLPLTLLRLDDPYDAAVVELGMSHRGELAQLTRIASPDVGVITRVAVEHLEFFNSIDDIALAERELVENLPWPEATAVLNADDERVARFAEVARGPVILFGTGAVAEFRAEAIEEGGLAGSEFEFVTAEGRTRLNLPLIGRHNVMNALAALAAASLWDIGASEAERVFKSLRPADKRGEVVRFEEGFSVINDTYNSSPTALTALVGLLASRKGYRRKLLAVGEMRELGDSSKELHYECGKDAGARREIDWIFGVQGHAEDFVRAAVEAGHCPIQAKFFENSEEAGKFIEKFVASGDLLLLKGSRGVRMEKILEAIDMRHSRASVPNMPDSSETVQKGRG